MPAPRRASGQPPRRRAPARPARVQAQPAPAPQGARLTARDIEMVRWICRHGIVTPQQVAARFFAREEGAPGQRAAYRRLAKLVDLGLLQRDWVAMGAPQVIRVTRQGARVADAGLQPAEIVLAELRHVFRVVELTERELARRPKGWGLVTERELRAERYRRMRGGESVKSRMPDALFVGPRGERIAIEVDESSKRSRLVEQLIADYRYGDDQYDAIWWFVPGDRVAARMRQIVEDNQAADLIEVRAWRS